MKIVIPDDYQDIVDQLSAFSLIRHHDVMRYREPARDIDQLVERLADADIVVSIRERVEFSRELLERLPKLKLIALVGRNSHMLDFGAATELGIPVSTGVSNSPVAPAELTLALIVASRRNVALEAERMKRGDWPARCRTGCAARRSVFSGRRHRRSWSPRGARARHEGAGIRPEEIAGEGAAAGYEMAQSKADLFERSDVLSLQCAA